MYYSYSEYHAINEAIAVKKSCRTYYVVATY